MHTLPRNERIRHRGRIAEVFRSGTRAGGALIAVRILANGLASSRVAVIAGKSLGNSVMRNRLRRRLRAVYRLHKDRLPPGWDFALLAKREALKAEWEVLCRDETETIARAVGGATGLRRPRQRP